MPSQEELAMGAIASGGVLVINEEVFPWLVSVTEDEVEKVVAREQAELERR